MSSKQRQVGDRRHRAAGRFGGLHSEHVERKILGFSE